MELATVYLMIEYFKYLQRKPEPIGLKESVKKKKTAPKKKKFTKLWFTEAYDGMIMAAPEIVGIFGLAGVGPAEIYSERLNPKKTGFDRRLYEYISDYFDNQLKPKREVIFDF